MTSLNRVLNRTLLIIACSSFFTSTSYSCDNGTGGTGIGFGSASICPGNNPIIIDNGTGGTGMARGVIEKDIAKRQAAEVRRKAAELKKRNSEILKRRKAINVDHNLKKNALRTECRTKSNNLRSQLQKRIRDYDIALRKRLNALPPSMTSEQRSQAVDRLKSNTLRLKRALNDDNKHRQLIITRECADRSRLLDRQFKLRIQDFERTSQKR